MYAAQAGKTTAENNTLASRNIGDCKTLSPEACGKAKELSQKILEKGLPSVEDVRDKLNSCKDDNCRKNAWAEYRLASDKTIETLKKMSLSDELSREDLAFINHDLARELAVDGRQSSDKLGMAEFLGWLNGGVGPLSGFFNTELREKELISKGFTPTDAAQLVKEEKRNLMIAEAATGFAGAKAGNKIQGAIKGSNVVNPATNKVTTDHVVVPSGKAPKTSIPNSVYEVSRADGTKSITYYDDKGRMFSREDYGQQRTHGSLGYDANGKVPPHEHKSTYNDRGYLDGKYYREIDKDGKAIGPWISEK